MKRRFRLTDVWINDDGDTCGRLKKCTLKVKMLISALNGDNCIKIVILGVRSLILWLQIAFYGSAGASPKTKFPTIKPTIFLSK